MNLESYFNKLKSDFPDINLPGIFEAEDYNESQLKINGIYSGVFEQRVQFVSSWSIQLLSVFNRRPRACTCRFESWFANERFIEI